MDKLDVMKSNSDGLILYWTKRLASEKHANKKAPVDIRITTETLEWFLWMIQKDKMTDCPRCETLERLLRCYHTITKPCDCPGICSCLTDWTARELKNRSDYEQTRTMV